MARIARVKIDEGGAYYHLCGRVAGVKGEYPLADKRCRRKIIDDIRFFAKVYCLEILGFCIMGNHYHLVVYMAPSREMPRKALRARAELLYKDTVLDGWLGVDAGRVLGRKFRGLGFV